MTAGSTIQDALDTMREAGAEIMRLRVREAELLDLLAEWVRPYVEADDVTDLTKRTREAINGR